MGLIYSASDSQALINGMKANINSGKSVVQELKNASQDITSSIGAGRALDGPAFNAGKDLFSALVIPTIERADNAFDDMSNTLSRYESADGEVSGEGLLDEDQLNLQKFSYQTLKAGADATAATLRGAEDLANTLAQAELAIVLGYYAGQNEQFSESLQSDIDKIEEKLRKLHTFNSAVNGLFNDELNNFKIVIQSVSVLSDTVVSSNGTYQFPVGVDKSWFTSVKAERDYEYQALQSLVGLEGAALNNLGLTQAQKDWYERLKMLMAANPAKAFEELYKSDTLWATLSLISQKFPKIADKFLDFMGTLERIGSTKAGKLLDEGIKFFGKITSPVQATLKGLGLEELLKGSKSLNLLGKGAKIIEFAGKAGTVITFASLALTGISTGITEGLKEKSVGKGVIGGTIGTVKSVGPLEGMAVGATIGSIFPGPRTIIGGGLGLALGTVNMAVQWVNPHLYNDVQKGAYELYDNAKNSMNQDVNAIKNVASDFFKDPIGTWNEGADLSKEVSKFIPKLPQMPKIGFGW
ncbi:MAG: LXG domain-containing protein [Streptococcaceae bacterium]|jgi:hypothetical protein|nr:LXG domain-containing protein [Streptococcaceae bacterium]